MGSLAITATPALEKAVPCGASGKLIALDLPQNSGPTTPSPSHGRDGPAPAPHRDQAPPLSDHKNPSSTRPSLTDNDRKKPHRAFIKCFKIESHCRLLPLFGPSGPLLRPLGIDWFLFSLDLLISQTDSINRDLPQ